ncbi:hypothetical protein [uncultured Helicobacter sp.]|uniref:hypothetical protein n=1 Tax=uncultured Helicobacter sp. TaxID=175537 RepID=UPI002591BDC0|nr:hypothetical protein [uncultured Helicobacter sp.]
MRKLIITIALFMGLGCNQAFGFIVSDPTNLVQNTITAIQQVASYARQISDSLRAIQEFDKHATEFTNETLGLGDLLGDINNVSRDISDIYQAKEDMEQFNKEVLSDPQGFFNDKYKKYTDNYNLYDKCQGLKEDALNICLRNSINYASGIKQHSDYGNIIRKLQKQLDKQIKEFDRARSQKDRENAALAIRATQAEMEKAKALNELESLEYRNNERIISEQREELLTKGFATGYSVADKYKNVGKE